MVVTNIKHLECTIDCVKVRNDDFELVCRDLSQLICLFEQRSASLDFLLAK